MKESYNIEKMGIKKSMEQRVIEDMVNNKHNYKQPIKDKANMRENLLINS